MLSNKVVYNLIFKKSSGYIHNIVKQFSLIPDLTKQKAFSFEKYLEKKSLDEHPFLYIDLDRNEDGTLYTRSSTASDFGSIYINKIPYEIFTNDERKKFVDELNKDMEIYCKKQESHFCPNCPSGPVMYPTDENNEKWFCPVCQTTRDQSHFDWKYVGLDQLHTYCSFKNIFKKNESFYIVRCC